MGVWEQGAEESICAYGKGITERWNQFRYKVLRNLRVDCSSNITKANVKSEIEVQVAYVGEIVVATLYGLDLWET
jgi:hypothetical protein